MSDKRAKGLCFWCDEKYENGHKCKGKRPQLFHIEVEDDEEEGQEEGEEEGGVTEVMCAQISLQALDGNCNFHTMRMVGQHNRRPLHVLLDSGSTHNFLDSTTAARLNCKIETVAPMWVKVADGGQLKCDSITRDFEWKMQGYTFTADLLILPLSGSDAVMGIQWFTILGPVLWDFKNLTMEFKHAGRKVKLRGATTKRLKGIQPGQLHKLMQNTGELSMMQVLPEKGHANPKLETPEVEGAIHEDISCLLQQFATLFEPFTDLPPVRDKFDHRIPLKEGTQAINIRPYRYPATQKSVIEVLVQELLDQGLIRDSNNPFSAPIVLVKKKDGGWRMCIDYRAINKVTVKDKFPIPIIEELLDELQGTSYFSKIDLKSGYHQIRMNEDDIHKTAFKTHFGHFEYLVMPFGLTNAPSTFQSLMNYVFKPYLRKFVLVFFDDILVYSPSWEQHIDHLQMVLNTMKSHSLHANLKKCSFGSTKIIYLGHIISE